MKEAQDQSPISDFSRTQEKPRQQYGRFLDWPGIAWSLLLYLLLPNALFCIVAFAAGVGRPYINLDYGLVIFLMLVGLRGTGVFIFFLLMLIDLLLIAGQIFPVVRLGDILYLSEFFLLASRDYQIASLALVLLIATKCIVLYRLRSRHNERFAATLLGAMALLYLFDLRAGATSQPHEIWTLSSHHPIASQLENFLEYRANEFFKNIQQEGEPFTSIPGDASAVSYWSALHRPKPRLLLVVVESWGVARQREIHEALLQPLRDIKGVRIEQGILPFDGTTIAGELRELCQLAPNHFNLAPVQQGFERCLPNRLKAQGYETLAMHGAVSQMYDRRDWYPRAGFDKSIFYESRSWPSRCYSFPGACDLDMMAEVARFFSTPGKRFMYWLTLNSHSTYDPRDIRLDAFDCSAFSIPDDLRACRYLKLQAQFFEGLARLLRVEAMRGVEVMLVGDHSPPMIESPNYKSLFEFKQVPWLSVVVD